MTNPLKQARAAEENGDLEVAAEAYARAGVEHVIDSGFETTTKCRVGVTLLLRSISCYARAGERRRATGLRRMTDGILSHMLSDPIEDSCLAGLLHEWTGDIHLFTDSGVAIEEYRVSAERYRDCPDGKQFSWGMEQEFDYGHWAVKQFLESEGYDVSDQFPVTDFDSRIRTKIDLADRRFDE